MDGICVVDSHQTIRYPTEFDLVWRESFNCKNKGSTKGGCRTSVKVNIYFWASANSEKGAALGLGTCASPVSVNIFRSGKHSVSPAYNNNWIFGI